PPSCPSTTAPAPARTPAPPPASPGSRSGPSCSLAAASPGARAPCSPPAPAALGPAWAYAGRGGRVCVAVQPGLDLGPQLGLVVLDDQDVIAPVVEDLPGHVSVGEQGVARRHLAAQGQHPQQLQGGLVLVGPGSDAQLGDDGGGGGHVGGQQVDAGGVA